MNIDFYDPLPRYYQLVEIFRSKIESGEWKERESIPSERDLDKIYSVSRATVRQAIEILISKGYLYRVRGKGTFVSPRRIIDLYKMSRPGFQESTRNRGKKSSEKHVSLDWVEIDDGLRDKMDLPADRRMVQRLVRLFYADEKLVCQNMSFLNVPENEGISWQELDKVGSLYTLLNLKYGHVPSEIGGYVEAAVAGVEEAGILQVDVGFPLIMGHYTIWTMDREVMEVNRVLQRGDYYSYFASRFG